MRPRRQAAFGLWAALAFSFAVLVHGAIHAAGSRTFVWDSPAHGIMLAAALVLLALVAGPLGLVGPRRERRRRLALVRAALGPPSWGFTAAGLALQAALAGLLLFAEGASLEPDRVVLALACGLIALLCSAFALRATQARVVAVLVALAAATAAPVSRAARRAVAPRAAAATIRYNLFVPNRPPPALAT